MKEMEAKELRIGNLIYSKRRGCNFQKGVIEIDLEAFRKIHLFDALNGLEPIPLTKEWLLKFGFVNTEAEENIFGFKLNSFWFINEWHIRNKFGAIILDIEIEYVHQLQNLYFALTGTELEYNEKK